VKLNVWATVVAQYRPDQQSPAEQQAPPPAQQGPAIQKSKAPEPEEIPQEQQAHTAEPKPAYVPESYSGCWADM
jgi:hypothetical protein